MRFDHQERPWPITAVPVTGDRTGCTLFSSMSNSDAAWHSLRMDRSDRHSPERRVASHVSTSSGPSISRWCGSLDNLKFTRVDCLGSSRGRSGMMRDAAPLPRRQKRGGALCSPATETYCCCTNDPGQFLPWWRMAGAEAGEACACGGIEL